MSKELKPEFCLESGLVIVYMLQIEYAAPAKKLTLQHEQDD